MKGRLTETWGAIIDDDLERLDGRWDQVVATIRRKTGEGVDIVERKIDDTIDSLEDSTENVSS